MDEPAVDLIVALVDDLPGLPAVAQRALSLLSDPTTEPEALESALSRDPSLAVRVLRLANSAYYRRSREITTLAGAVVVLGFKTLHTLVLSSAVHRVISSAGEVAPRLWEHCYAAALACRELARLAGAGAVAREEAFLAGLFHDVGKGVIAHKFPGIYDGRPGAEAEREQLGFDHAQLGSALLAAWEIPAELRHAVGEHHRAPPEGRAERAAAGDWVAWQVAPGLGPGAPPLPEGGLAGLGVPDGEVHAVLQVVETYLSEERAGR
ncbi:MAG: hypothetical protein Kow0092_07350 [Deferrisomatales bacterium]